MCIDIPYVFHIYIYICFLNMFHIFSLMCSLIYGVKTRSGHDRGWVQWSFGTNFYDFQWKKATYDSWLEHACSIASSAWARLLHRLFGLLGWVGNHRQLFLGPALAWHNPKRFCWGMALTENANLAVGSFIVSSEGNGWTMTREAWRFLLSWVQCSNGLGI